MAMSCGIDHRRGSDPVLLWLWCRPTATTLIRPLAWEPPCALSVTLKKKKKKNRKKKKEKGNPSKTQIHLHMKGDKSKCRTIYSQNVLFNLHCSSINLLDK